MRFLSGLMYFFLIRLCVADTQNDIGHIGLLSNPNDLNWLIISCLMFCLDHRKDNPFGVLQQLW